ncbi:hypothetical protein, partial [Nostoc sp. ChiQUE01b]|uniref:hypothetical protein n=1 Tax=Nostoc sp. ChiQUE01b TaxID=3075376 RepID=UPI002AD34012
FILLPLFYAVFIFRIGLLDKKEFAVKSQNIEFPLILAASVVKMVGEFEASDFNRWKDVSLGQNILKY